jgi:predicted transcriptional regulator
MKRQENRKDFVSLTLRLPKAIYQEIKVEADRQDTSRSFYIVEAIKQNLRKEMK